MVSVTVKNLTKTYEGGNTIAVRDLNLVINDGEFFTLLGPSGCGKTTTLYSIAGLLEPDEGEIVIGDKVVTSKADKIRVYPQDRELAMVFQDYALYPHMKVRKILAFPLENIGVDKHEIEERVEETAELLDISNLLDRKPGQLSGGQRQRVALGRAIIRNPKVFLFDEPLSNLDAKLRIRMRFELKELQQKLGITTIYVTHDQTEAMSMSDRIMLMKDGRVAQVGTSDDMFHRPKNIFVASFIGTPPMNLVDCTVVRKNGKLWFDATEFEMPVPPRMIPDIEKCVNKAVVMGFRPQNVSETSGESEYGIRVTVRVVESMGTSYLLHVNDGSHSLIAEVIETKAKPGEGKTIKIDPDKMHIFDKESGDAIVNAIAI